MAVVKGGADRMGEKIFAPLENGRIVEAEICSPIFYDPNNERQKL